MLKQQSKPPLLGLTIASKLRAMLFATIAAFAVMAAIAFLAGQSVVSSMHEAEGVRGDLSVAGGMRLANIELVLVAMDSIIDRDEGQITAERMAVIEKNSAFLKDNVAAAQALARQLGTEITVATLEQDVAEVLQAIGVTLPKL